MDEIKDKDHPPKKKRPAPPGWWLEKYAGFSKEDFEFVRKIATEGGELSMPYCAPKELIYQDVDYTKPEVIQALLRFYYDFKDKADEDFNAELICIYIDIDKAVAAIKITDRQMEAVTNYMEGWTEEEIGVMMNNITHQAVHKLVMKVCEKVSKFLTDKGLQNQF